MQFEPRLFSPDAAARPAADCTADLPDDLAALAEQLREDAGRLSAQYPAAPRRSRLGRRWSLVAAVAAVSFSTGIAGGAWLVWSPDPRSTSVADSAPRATLAEAAAEPGTARQHLRVVRQEEPALQAGAKASAAGSLVGAGPRALPRTNRPPARDEAALLRRQVAAFELVIVRLQEELRERADRQSQTEAMVAELQREIAELRRQLDAAP